MTPNRGSGGPKAERAQGSELGSKVEGAVVALTGTPGTGKTSVAEVLRDQGHGVLALSRFVGDPRFDLGADPEREGTVMLDEEALDAHLAKNLQKELGGRTRPPIFIESHFAHTLGFVDRIIVLRCRPSVLQKRLQERGYPEHKVRENMEVEGMDLILQEALHTVEEQRGKGRMIDIGEADTTQASVEETAHEVLRLATTASANLEIGRLDWSDEVLGWY